MIERRLRKAALNQILSEEGRTLGTPSASGAFGGRVGEPSQTGMAKSFLVETEELEGAWPPAAKLECGLIGEAVLLAASYQLLLDSVLQSLSRDLDPSIREATERKGFTDRWQAIERCLNAGTADFRIARQVRSCRRFHDDARLSQRRRRIVHSPWGAASAPPSDSAGPAYFGDTALQDTLRFIEDVSTAISDTRALLVAMGGHARGGGAPVLRVRGQVSAPKLESSPSHSLPLRKAIQIAWNVCLDPEAIFNDASALGLASDRLQKACCEIVFARIALMKMEIRGAVPASLRATMLEHVDEWTARDFAPNEEGKELYGMPLAEAARDAIASYERLAPHMPQLTAALIARTGGKLSRREPLAQRLSEFRSLFASLLLNLTDGS